MMKPNNRKPKSSGRIDFKLQLIVIVLFCGFAAEQRQRILATNLISSVEEATLASKSTTLDSKSNTSNTTTISSSIIAEPPADQPNTTTTTIKILCFILTMDSSEHLLRSEAIRSTWGRRCDKLLFVQNGTKLSEQLNNNNNNGVLTIPIERESRDLLWFKVSQTFAYIYKHYLNQYDWFMKADDDTYVILDSLREFLKGNGGRHSKFVANEPIYFGYKFKPFVRQGYMSGGPGYVLSRRALQLLVERGLAKGRSECQLAPDKAEDVEMGRCLESVGVEAGDTRDSNGLPTFLALSPMELLAQHKMDSKSWYYSYAFYGPPKAGKECCSKRPISFHYIEPKLMRFIDWLLYDVKMTHEGRK